MASQSVSLCVEPHLGLMTRYLLLFDSYDLVFCGAPSLTRGRMSFVHAAGPCQRSLSRVRVHWYLRPYFTVASYDPQGHGVGIRPRLQRPFLSLYKPSARNTQKTQPIFEKACLLIHCLAMDVLLLRVYASAGMCLPTRCLAMGLYVTIFNSVVSTIQVIASLI
jgi:hypothetical protein